VRRRCPKFAKAGALPDNASFASAGVTGLDPAIMPDRKAARAWIPIIAALCLIVALQADLLVVKSINWDEFFFFSMIQQLHDGSLEHALQTFPTRIFAFLRLLPLGPIDQLLAGRAVMLGCELVAAAALFGIARRFCDARVAALCALTYLTAGDVFLHGFAFRADPLLTALLMSGLWCVVTRRLDWRTVALVSVLVGLAGVVSIKAVFFAGPFAGAAWLRWNEAKDTREPVASRLAAMAAGSLLVFACLLALHRSGLAASGTHGSTAESALSTVFAAGLVPQAKYLWQQILLAPHVAMMIAAAPLFWTRLERAERIAMASFLLPLLTVVFYRNSYPYYFVYVLAPAMVTVGPAVERLLRYVGFWPYAALLAGNALLLNLAEPRNVLSNQRALVEGVHEIFPRPVAYFGFSGMVGDFPRPLSILVSGWGLQRYRQGEEPSLVQLAEERPVPLLIVNHPVIEAALKGVKPGKGLLPADRQLLRDNYIPHWGQVWVAGKRIARGSGTRAQVVAVPGTYTLEGASIAVDGRQLKPGDLVEIGRGAHFFTANPSKDADLRWGDHLAVPSRTPPPAAGLFTEY
jgi:hypothetical protein